MRIKGLPWMYSGLIIIIACTTCIILYTLLSMSDCRSRFIQVFGVSRGSCLYDACRTYLDPKRFHETCKIVSHCGDQNSQELLDCMKPYLHWTTGDKQNWTTAMNEIVKSCPPVPNIPCGSFPHPLFCLFT